MVFSRRAVLSSLTLLSAASCATASEVVAQDSSDYSTGVLGSGPFQSFYSSDLTPAEWNIVLPINDTTAPLLSDGLIWFAPRGTDVHQPGALIFTQDGHLVWSGEQYGQTLTFQKSTFQGEPVITLWSGTIQGAGFGSGYDLILNQNYELIHNITIQGENGTLSDFHEFQITTNDTALMTGYYYSDYDLNFYNITGGVIVSGLAQELNITSNEPIFTWNSLDHVNPSDCYASPGTTGTSDANPWDYFHINSIEKDDSDHYLISSRHCHTIYYVNSTGDIVWQMGGKNSSFTMGDGTEFEWQHDARWVNGSTTQISLFDNAATSWESDETEARGLILDLDFTNMTVTLNQEMLPWNATVSPSQGGVQVQENGNRMIGWGQVPWFAEYNPSGEILWTVQFGVGNVQGYRARRNTWTGVPLTLPSIAVISNTTTSTTSVYASWNGHTEISSWNLYGSTDGNSTTLLSNATKSGFETQFNLTSNQASSYTYFQVAALNSNSSMLGWSNFSNVGSTAMLSPSSNETAQVTVSAVGVGAATATASATATATSTSSGVLSGSSTMSLTVALGLISLALVSYC